MFLKLRNHGLLAICAALISSQFVFASNKSAEELLVEGKALYAQREDLSKVDQALVVLNEAATKAVAKTNLKFEILILTCRAQYWKGQHELAKDLKMKLYELGMKAALAARAENPDFAESYYYYGINLARWAEAKGVLESLAKKKDLMDSMEGTQARETMAGDLGETLDGYGADRVLGRMYFKLPAFAGGDWNKSYQHLNLTVQSAPNWPLNIVYLADTLHVGNNQQKAQACQMLADLSKMNPETLNPDRIPESKEEIAEGVKLMGEICH